MAIDIDLSSLCISVQIGKQICVTFPGGLTVCAQFGIELGDPSAIIRSFLAGVNSALAPAQPIFDIIDVLIAIVNCVKAVPEALSVPPDPTKIFSCIPGLLEALEKVAGIPLQIPVMIKQIILAIVTGVQAILGELTAFIHYESDLLAAATLAAKPGNLVLKSIYDCEHNNFAIELQNMNESMKPLNRLIGIINLLLEALTGQSLPTFSDLGSDVTAAIQPIQQVLSEIQMVANYLPG